MVGGGSGGKEINNGLKRSMEDSRNKHQSGNAREPHNRVDLELTKCLKRTKAVQERSCGPVVPRREHGGVGRPRCRRTTGGLLCRRPPPTAHRFCPLQTLRRLHERKRKRKRGTAKAVRQEGAPHAESEKRQEWPWRSKSGAAAGGPHAEGDARRDARATNPQPASVVLSPARVDRRASESSRGSLSMADSNN